MDVTFDDDLLIPYRLRTVRVGVFATLIVLAALFPYGQFSPEVNRPHFYVLLTVALVGVLGVYFLPWAKLFERGLGVMFMYAWSVLDILLITLLIPVSGGGRSTIWVLYALTTIFFAASYPPKGQAVLLFFTFACYLAALWFTGWEVSAPAVVVHLATLATTGIIGSFLFRELMQQMGAHSQASAEAARRAAIMTGVAQAARAISSLDTELVFDSVVGSAIDLGFDAAGIGMFDETETLFRIVKEQGLPEDFVQKDQPANEGAVGLVLKSRSTVVISDYQETAGARPRLVEAGFRSVISTPIWVQDSLAGTLSGALREQRKLTDDEVEAFELLAAQAGRALENAQSFEEERRMVERFAELDRLKSDFLSNVSHELRTPLTVIKGVGMTLQRKGELDSDLQQDLLRRLNENARALESIITSLLDFTRLNAGRMKPSREVVDVSELIRGVTSRLSPLTEDHPTTLEVDESLQVDGDPHLLERVLENLLINAVKYTPSGTRILVSAHKEGSAAAVVVQDEGPGIPKTELPHLGQRFFRGGNPDTRDTRGMGLGLALCREILELHGSTLEIDSEVGRGSRFGFRLPLAMNEAA